MPTFLKIRNSDGYGLTYMLKKPGKPTQAIGRLTQSVYKFSRNLTCDNWFKSEE